MNFFRLIPTLFLCCGLLMSPSARADMTILILRHGEKPPLGLGQLNCQGLNRSLALPDVLLDRYGTPQALYASNPAIKKTDKGVPYYYIRPLATIEPLAIRLGIPVNITWSMADIQPLAEHLLSQKSGTHVIAWEHHYAEKLTRLLLSALGQDENQVPEWADADFDSIYVIRIHDETGPRLVTFARERENLNDLPSTCK